MNHLKLIARPLIAAVAATAASSVLEAQINLDAAPGKLPGLGPARPSVEAPGESNPEKKASPLPNGLLTFTDGNMFKGRLHGIDKDGRISWKHPDAIAPTVFKSTNVAKIKRARSKKKAPVSKSMVKLTNGDTIPCEVLSLDQSELKINTWYGGAFTIKRDDVSSIAPHGIAANAIYSGPSEIDDWTLQQVNGSAKTPFTYSNGAFYEQGQGGIGRKFDLPDAFSIKFDLSWSGQNLNMSVGLLTDTYENAKDEKEKENEEGEPKPDKGNVKAAVDLTIAKANPAARPEGKKPKNKPLIVNQYNQLVTDGYMLAISPYNTSLSRCTTVGENTNWTALGNGTNFNMHQIARMRVEIRVDRKKKTFALYMNEILRAKWRDSNEDFDPKGSGIAFNMYGQGRARIKNILISPWNGRLGHDDELIATESDIVKLVNGTDRLSGKVLSLKDGILKMKASYGEFELPEDRIANVYLASDGKSRPELPENPIRFRFKNGGSIILLPDSMQDGKLTANHITLGKRDFDANAFSQIDFADVEEPVDDIWSQ